MARGAAEHAAVVVQRAVSRSSGCHASGSSIGSMSGTQPHSSPALASEPLVGTKRNIPSRRPSRARGRAGREGCAGPAGLAGLLTARDRHHLELAVAAGHADRGDPKAGDLGDPSAMSWARLARRVDQLLARLVGPRPSPVTSISVCSGGLSILRRRRLRYRSTAGPAMGHGVRTPVDSPCALREQPRRGRGTAADRGPRPHEQGPRTRAGSSVSGPRVRTSPSSPTSGSTRCSTGAGRPASR